MPALTKNGPEGTPRAAIGYARVSTDKQEISPEAQIASIRAYATLKGLALGDIVVDDGVSGGTPIGERPGGAKVIAALASGKVQTVIATKLDRLFRNVIDCLTVVQAWDAKGVALHLIDMGGQSIDTSSSMGRFFLTLMAGLAEMERMRIRERTSVVMKHLAKTGRHTGGPAPYGLVYEDEELREEPHEQAAIALAVKLKATGASLRAIARTLHEKGYVARNGKEFQAVQVRSLLTSSVRRTEAVRKRARK